MARAHTMTPARRAALRKAQLASAKKRKRSALVRNTGRGVIGSKRGSRKRRYRIARGVGALAAAGAVAYGTHLTRQHLKENRYTGSVIRTAKYDKSRSVNSGSKRVQVVRVRGAVAGSVHAMGRDYRFVAKRYKRR